MNNTTTLGTYIYMGMGKIQNQTVCMSVAYKLDYAVKKALQFENLTNKTATFYKVNKIKVGQLEAETSFNRNELKEYVDKFSISTT